MGYVESNLMQGEKVVYSTKTHWIVLVLPIVLFVTGVLEAKPVPGLGGLLIIIGVVLGLGRLLDRNASEFAVTTKRVVLKVGLIRRRTVELMLNKVEALSVDQGVFGRLFNYGTIVTGGTGGSKSPFKAVRSPLVLRKHVYEQIEAQQQRASA